MEMPKIPTLAELEAQERILDEREKQRKAENDALCARNLPLLVAQVVKHINSIKQGNTLYPINKADLCAVPLNPITVVNLLNEEFKRQGVDSFLVAKAEECYRSGITDVVVRRRS